MNSHTGDLLTKWTDLLKQKQQKQYMAQTMALAWRD